MSGAATVFLDKAARIGDAPVVDWDRIHPEDGVSLRTGQPEIDPACFRQVSKKDKDPKVIWQRHSLRSIYRASTRQKDVSRLL